MLNFDRLVASAIQKSFDPPVALLSARGYQCVIPFKIFTADSVGHSYLFWEYIHGSFSIALLNEIIFPIPILSGIGIVVDPKETIFDHEIILAQQVQYLTNIVYPIRKWNAKILFLCIRQSATATSREKLLGRLALVPEVYCLDYHVNQLTGLGDDLNMHL
jgi:hypothetical protein